MLIAFFLGTLLVLNKVNKNNVTITLLENNFDALLFVGYASVLPLIWIKILLPKLERKKQLERKKKQNLLSNTTIILTINSHRNCFDTHKK